MKIPFLLLHPIHQEIKTEVLKSIERVYDSGWFLLGEELENFEKEYAQFTGTKHAIGVGCAYN